MLCGHDPWSSPLPPAGVLDRREIIYPISLAVAWRRRAAWADPHCGMLRRQPSARRVTMPATIGRRELIAAFGGAAAWPLAAGAQQPGKLPTIGFLGATTASFQSQHIAAFARRLRELGWIEGSTVAIEYRWAEGRPERFAEIATEFVRLKVDVIVTLGGAVLAAKQATSVIPIVFASAGGRSAAASSRACRDRAATSPGCRSRPPILLANGSNSCARFSLMSAGWRSLAMWNMPPPCWRWVRLRQRAVRSASRSSDQKFGEQRISHLPSRR